MFKLAPVAIACIFAAAPVVAQSTNPPPPAPAQTAKPAKPKMICEREQEIGSRLGAKRICRTQEEWDALRADARSNVERAQQQPH